MTFTETANKIVAHLAHPGHADETHPIEHPAHHGASLEHHDEDESWLKRVTTSEATTKLVQSQGNCGVGMEEGLRSKAIAQQERVAERSRLRHEGLLEPHQTHEAVINFDDEHREVAQGRDVQFDNHGEGAGRSV